jgi:hypothetical protein
MSINLPTHKALWLVAGLGMLSLAACMHREPTVSQQPAPPTTMTTAAVQQERMAIAHACAADIDSALPRRPAGRRAHQGLHEGAYPGAFDALFRYAAESGSVREGAQLTGA